VTKRCALLAAALLLAFMGCDTAVSGVSLDTPSLTLNVKASERLNATLHPANATIKGIAWTTSDAAVAGVGTDGTVTALKPGTATITATTQDGEKTASCKVTVVIHMSQITLDRAELELEAGNGTTLKATPKPKNATSKALRWSSSNPDVATVSDTGEVKALSFGEATITVSAADGGKAAAVCSVAVRMPRPKRGDVLVAGRDGDSAVLWINGRAQTLGRGAANSVFLSGDDVYVAGAAWDSATLWVNGVAQRLGEKGRDSVARSVCVSGGDVYVAGKDGDGAVLWINGVARMLAKGEDTSASAVFVHGGDVYVAGQKDSEAMLWVNGQSQALNTRGSAHSNAHSVFVFEGTVFVAGGEMAKGYTGTVGTLWVDGGRNLYAVSRDFQIVGCNSVFVSANADVYVAGESEGYASVWKNEKLKRLSGEYNKSRAGSVHVSGGDVYVAGAERDSQNRPCAVLWKDGEPRRLGGGGSEASCVVVR
jgi:hypothetical protein